MANFLPLLIPSESSRRSSRRLIPNSPALSGLSLSSEPRALFPCVRLSLSLSRTTGTSRVSLSSSERLVDPRLLPHSIPLYSTATSLSPSHALAHSLVYVYTHTHTHASDDPTHDNISLDSSPTSSELCTRARVLACFLSLFSLISSPRVSLSLAITAEFFFPPLRFSLILLHCRRADFQPRKFPNVAGHINARADFISLPALYMLCVYTFERVRADENCIYPGFARSRLFCISMRKNRNQDLLSCGSRTRDMERRIES